MIWVAIQLHETVPLINGYRYFYSGNTYYDNGVTIRLFDIGKDRTRRIEKNCERNGHTQAGPNVDGYRVYQGVIVGHVTKPEHHQELNPLCYKRENETMWDASITGYFIIDTRADITYNGLSKSDWIKKLRKIGINSEPKLYKPSIYDKILGRNKP